MTERARLTVKLAICLVLLSSWRAREASGKRGSRDQAVTLGSVTLAAGSPVTAVTLWPDHSIFVNGNLVAHDESAFEQLLSWMDRARHIRSSTGRRTETTSECPSMVVAGAGVFPGSIELLPTPDAPAMLSITSQGLFAYGVPATPPRAVTVLLQWIHRLANCRLVSSVRASRSGQRQT